MAAASRTPEGLPSRCVVCGAENAIEYSLVGDDAPCPNCGHLLSRSAQMLDRLRNRLAAQLGIHDPTAVDAMRLDSLGSGSLGMVELVMELEEELDVVLPEDASTKLVTFGDLFRAIIAHSKR